MFLPGPFQLLFHVDYLLGVRFGLGHRWLHAL